MKIESMRIFADDLNLSVEISELIYAKEHVDGVYAITKKGKASDKKQWQPEIHRLNEIITKRINIVLPEYSGWGWRYGRIGRSVHFIMVINPDWK